jgi:hypothetical protein
MIPRNAHDVGRRRRGSRGPRRARLAALTAGFLIGAAATAAPGQASTLAYVKNAAVWVSAADGSDTHEVGSGLSFPALGDDGTVYALAGSAQVAVLPPGEPQRQSIPISGAGADQLSVTPDGGELAWRDVQFGLQDLQHGVSVERVSDGRRTDILSDEWPTWFSDTQLTMGGPNGGDLFDAATDQEQQAIWPAEYTTAYDTSINQYAIDRGATRGAASIDITTGGGPPNMDPAAHTLVIFPVSNTTPAVPTTQFCVLDGSQANPIEISDLTWSPDGSALAWQAPDGIHEVAVPSTTDCAQIPASQLVIPGGSEPSWGPSDDRRFPEPTAPGPPAPSPKPGPTPSPKPNPAPIGHRLAGLTLPHRLTAAAFAKHGLTVHLKCPATGILHASATTTKKTARRDHLPLATVATGTARVKHAGTVSLVLHAGKRDSKRLRASHGVPLTLTFRIGSLHTATHVTLR